MPNNISFEEAAAVPESGVVALQGLQNKGKIQSGQKVLVYGASGGIGTFAVQIAKSFDTEVTGVCSTRNIELVQSLGADQVIDYTQKDFVEMGEQYDLILATAGYRSIFDYKRALKPSGHYVATGGDMKQIFQPMLLGSWISSGGRKMTNLAMKPDKNDLTYLKELIETGKVLPVIDNSYPLSELPAALEYYAEGHSRGKVIVTIEH
jgi:NADPH:quinone reductase-like Zn-dependent oxidoreductase